MKTKKMSNLMRGFSSVTASVLAISVLGTSIADSYRKNLDDFLGTSSYVTSTDADSARFVSDYDTIEDMAAAAKDIAIREGEEGTVIMKNDNDVFPIATNSVALFGLAAYAPYPYNSGDLKAGNDDAVDLLTAFKDAGVDVNSSLEDFYVNNLLNPHDVENTNQWTGEVTISTGYDNIYTTEVGDMADFQINEITPDRFEDYGASSDWKSAIDKDNTTGICVFARAGGESNTYAPGSALDSEGNATGKDPLALSDEELAVVDAAKETCSKVIVLLNTGNTMGIADIAEGGAHKVDGIAYIGCINDYQCTGIVNVLTGQVNATGALTDTYVVDNNSIPAVQNFGGDYYADAEIVAASAENGYDSRYPNTDIGIEPSGSFGGGSATYNSGQYIVEAEGIYVGYKYFETRYFDSIANPESGAASASGATQGSAWDYDSEVIYSFGHGLSYLDYSQEVKSVDVDKTEDGNITAVVAVTNNSDQDGRFLAQLYVQQPYTDYDKENNVEKAAIMFLNSAKVDVAAGATEEVTITVPTKYLASYDYTNAKTYILDEGDYYFTAAAGSHEAVNNVLAAMGKTTADGMDAEARGTATVWNGNTSLDTTTFALSNNTEVTNVADDADLNYWTGEDTVTYLTRQDWEGTYPINYNTDAEVKIADSPKKDEWIAALKGETYTIATDSPAAEGEDTGLRFSTTDIGYEQLENIEDDYWNTLVAQITIDEAVGAVIHGGSQSDVLTNVENPIVLQNEGVNGFTTAYTDEETGKTYHFNVNSQTLLGSSFNPDLAYEWGLVEGNSGLWIGRYDLWGTGLTQRRTPYNGRNYEYISEDAMLTNRIGYGIISGCNEKGIINGAKHIGFNDQEHNRNGIAAYMNEQKIRETDLRCFQGALEDAQAMAVMVAFNRLGANNMSHYAPVLKTILRDEWGYTGIISTDMMNNSYYFNPESMIMATVTQVADFGGDDSHINLGEGKVDATWAYISQASVENDSALVEQARQNLKYQLYTFANSAVLNVSTEQVATWWDNALAAIRMASMILTIVFVLAWLAFSLMPEKKKEAK